MHAAPMVLFFVLFCNCCYLEGWCSRNSTSLQQDGWLEDELFIVCEHTHSDGVLGVFCREVGVGWGC